MTILEQRYMEGVAANLPRIAKALERIADGREQEKPERPERPTLNCHRFVSEVEAMKAWGNLTQDERQKYDMWIIRWLYAPAEPEAQLDGK